MKESLEATLKDVELTKEVYRLYTLEHLTQQEISVYWASRDHVRGTGCPHYGHRVPNVWDALSKLLIQNKKY